MAGTVLGIDETNPKRGAIQSDASRVDGLRLFANAAATKEKFPVGSIASIQEETTSKKQIAVIGAKPYDGDPYETYVVLSVGFLEASTQNAGTVNQSIGEISEGDFAVIVSGVNFLAAVPTASGAAPASGGIAYATPDGEAAATAASDVNVATPIKVSYGTAGKQARGQLRPNYAFARMSSPLLA